MVWFWKQTAYELTLGWPLRQQGGLPGHPGRAPGHLGRPPWQPAGNTYWPRGIWMGGVHLNGCLATVWRVTGLNLTVPNT